MPKSLALLLALSVAASAEDFEVTPSLFRSVDNRIEEVHTETRSKRGFLVLKFEKKLSGKNSRGRAILDSRSNYGDSASVYAYLEWSDDQRGRAELTFAAFREQLPVDVYYACGEQPDDRKRMVFPAYAETNCEISALTVKRLKDKDRRRGLF